MEVTITVSGTWPDG